MKRLSRLTGPWMLVLLGGCGAAEQMTDEIDTAHLSAQTVPAAATADFQIFPPKIYSGFDGTHTYKAPAIAHSEQDISGVTWSISDDSIASVAAEGEHVMLTMKKAGAATLTAKAGSLTATATLVVYPYTAEQHEAGSKRYVTAADANNPPCVQCHGASRGDSRPNHTPTEVDADNDDELQHTFTTGVDPEGRPIAEFSEFRDLLNGKKHQWKVTEVEKTGLLAYLRSLAPLGWPEFDAPTTEKDKDAGAK